MKSAWTRLGSAWAWLGTLVLVLAAAPLSGVLFAPSDAPAAFVIEEHPASPPSAEPIEYRDHALDAAGQVMVHSASLTLLANSDDIRAYWFGGSREGGPDVAIYTARYSADADAWSTARKAVTRQDVARHLGRYIKKLGNPVAFLDASERLWLFFVSVSIGGWAGSAVNYTISHDGGETFGEIKRLTSSPFFNVSTLVRGAPVAMQDGGLIVPVYHEFIGKFAELMVLGADGELRDKRRISWGRGTLQPVLVPTSAHRGVVFMRTADVDVPYVIRADTRDAGRSFSRPEPTTLPNPNSAVSATLLLSREIAMLYNPSVQWRDALALATATAQDDWRDWTRWHDFERIPPGMVRGISYPSWLRDRRGRLHAAWTHSREYIRHAVFNEAWVRGMHEPLPIEEVWRE